MNALGKFTRDRRGALAEIARRVGASDAQVSRVAQGKSRPSPELARKIEAATGGEVTAASLLGVGDGQVGTQARPLNDGRWFAAVEGESRVELPAALLRAFGFEDGDTVVFRQTKDGVLMSSQRKAIRRIQDELSKLARPGESVVDELIAERRAEAARE